MTAFPHLATGVRPWRALCAYPKGYQFSHLGNDLYALVAVLSHLPTFKVSLKAAACLTIRMHRVWLTGGTDLRKRQIFMQSASW
ncbi:hypothetical protein [Brasilonema bromeliae]|uniref:hypothetical protein n=1 Tax=Brasilonema bromeliae TaxID=383615 RepID=UPI00145CB206|nr:hypothetical protein [Brasilonema bromeliae]